MVAQIGCLSVLPNITNSTSEITLFSSNNVGFLSNTEEYCFASDEAITSEVSASGIDYITVELLNDPEGISEFTKAFIEGRSEFNPELLYVLNEAQLEILMFSLIDHYNNAQNQESVNMSEVGLSKVIDVMLSGNNYTNSFLNVYVTADSNIRDVLLANTNQQQKDILLITVRDDYLRTDDVSHQALCAELFEEFSVSYIENMQVDPNQTDIENSIVNTLLFINRMVNHADEEQLQREVDSLSGSELLISGVVNGCSEWAQVSFCIFENLEIEGYSFSIVNSFDSNYASTINPVLEKIANGETLSEQEIATLNAVSGHFVVQVTNNITGEQFFVDTAMAENPLLTVGLTVNDLNSASIIYSSGDIHQIDMPPRDILIQTCLEQESGFKVSIFEYGRVNERDFLLGEYLFNTEEEIALFFQSEFNQNIPFDLNNSSSSIPYSYIGTTFFVSTSPEDFSAYFVTQNDNNYQIINRNSFGEVNCMIFETIDDINEFLGTVLPLPTFEDLVSSLIVKPLGHDGEYNTFIAEREDGNVTYNVFENFNISDEYTYGHIGAHGNIRLNTVKAIIDYYDINLSDEDLLQYLGL